MTQSPRFKVRSEVLVIVAVAVATSLFVSSRRGGDGNTLSPEEDAPNERGTADDEDPVAFCEASTHPIKFNSFDDDPGAPFPVEFKLDRLAAGQSATLNCRDYGAPDGYLGECLFLCPKEGGAFETPIVGHHCQCTAGCGKIRKKIKFLNGVEARNGDLVKARLEKKRFGNRIDFDCGTQWDGYKGSCFFTCDDQNMGKWVRDQTQPCTCANKSDEEAANPTTATATTTEALCEASTHSIKFNSFDGDPGAPFMVAFKLEQMSAGQSATLNCKEYGAPEGYLGECFFQCPKEGSAFEAPIVGKNCQCTAGCGKTIKKILFSNLKGLEDLLPSPDGLLRTRLETKRFGNQVEFDCSTKVAGYGGSCIFTCDAENRPLGKWARDKTQDCSCTPAGSSLEPSSQSTPGGKVEEEASSPKPVANLRDVTDLE